MVSDSPYELYQSIPAPDIGRPGPILKDMPGVTDLCHWVTVYNGSGFRIILCVNGNGLPCECNVRQQC